MNSPLIPDKSFKLLVYVGVILVLYFGYNGEQDSRRYVAKQLECNVEIVRLQIQQERLHEELKEINKEAVHLAKKYSIDNPLHISDSGYIFVRTISGDRKEVAASDSIAKFLNSYNRKNEEIALKNDELRVKKYELSSLLESIDTSSEYSLSLIILGFLLFIVGISIWMKNEDLETNILKRQNIDKPTFSPYCQSCGKTFNSIIKYGKEQDNTINYHFCEKCYSNGSFINPELTLKEIKETRQNELKSKDKSKLKIKLELLRIDNLDRWNF